MTFIEEIKKPVNLFFAFLGIAGLAWGVFTYVTEKKVKSLSYQVTEPSSLIYDSKNSSSKIKVMVRMEDSLKTQNNFKDIDTVYMPVEGNVYLLTGVIWNSGDKPITKEDIRKEITLTLASAKRILEFKIVKQIDSEVAKFRLVHRSNNSIVLNWNYFDPGYAFKFQVIYSGNENSSFKLAGKILEIKTFQKVVDDSSNPPLSKIGTFIAICSTIVLTGFRALNKYYTPKNSPLVSAAISILLFATTFSIMYYLFFIFLHTNTPIPI